MLVNAKWYPVPTTPSPFLPRSYDVGTTSMPFLLRWYYVVSRSIPRPLTATLVLRKFTCSKFDHVLAVHADLTTLLPRFYCAHPVPTMLIRFPLRSHLFKRA